MRGRVIVLTLALGAALGLQIPARAHRLKAACQFLPGRMVRVETWFDNGDTPRKGEVEVLRPDGEPLAKGRLSSQGLFLFDALDEQALQVVVEAGEGHRAEVAIKPGEVIVAQVTQPAAPSHAEPFPIKDVLIGVAFLMAATAFFLSLRNARRIRELRGGDKRRPEGGG